MNTAAVATMLIFLQVFKMIPLLASNLFSCSNGSLHSGMAQKWHRREKKE